MTPDTYLVRLKPYNKQHHCVLRRYTIAGVRFECGHWFRVELDLATYLRNVRQPPGHPGATLAFDVCTEDEARVLVAQEKAAKRPAAPGDALRLRRARRRVAATPISFEEDDAALDFAAPSRQSRAPGRSAFTKRPSTPTANLHTPVDLDEGSQGFNDELPLIEEDMPEAEAHTIREPAETGQSDETTATKPPAQAPKPKQKKKRKSK